MKNKKIKKVLKSIDKSNKVCYNKSIKEIKNTLKRFKKRFKKRY